MDLKETYDFLLQPKRISDEIWRKTLRRKELESCLLPKGISYDKDRVQSSPEDQTARVMAEVADLDHQIEELQQRRAFQILEVSELIDRLDDSREATILDAYYLGGKSMGEIAEHLHYSFQHTYRLRAAGVEKMRKMRIESVV